MIRKTGSDSLAAVVGKPSRARFANSCSSLAAPQLFVVVGARPFVVAGARPSQLPLSAHFVPNAASGIVVGSARGSARGSGGVAGARRGKRQQAG